MKYLTISTILTTILQSPSTTAAFSPTAFGGPDSPIDVTPQNYTDAEGVLLQGFLSLPPDINSNSDTAPLPAVIILHDASGPDTYEQQRATILAHSYGYVGFVADIFGLLTVKPAADAPWSESGAFVSQFTNNATLFTQRIQAAVDYVRALDEVDETKVGMIGYCLGGTGIVHYLNMYGEVGSDGSDVPLAGVVAFHPSLSNGVGPGPFGSPSGKIDIPSLFLTGGADFLTGPQAMAKLEEDMMMGSSDDGDVDSSTPWETVRYAKIGHAFSNWLSEGSYDERADARSWHSMTTFLEEEFGFGLSDYSSSLDSPEEQVEKVNYTDSMDGDHLLTGYVSLPEGMAEGEVLPVVIILPHAMDMDGPDRYEQQRATQVASDVGYIGFVADIYSHDLKDTPALELEELYHSNTTKYLSRIRAAVDHVKTMEGVDGDKIAVIGFGFGGSGALYYALSGDEVDGAVKAIASIHGELGHVANSTADMTAAAAPSDGSNWGSGTTGGDSDWGSGTTGGDSDWGSGTTGSDSDWVTEDVSSTWNNETTARRRMSDSTHQPQIIIQSGADGDAMEDVIKLEQTLIDMGANYELTRFSDTKDNFTIWSDGNYNPRASARSFDQLGTVLNEVFTATASDDGTNSPEVASTGAPVAAPITKSTESPIAATVESTESPVVAPITKATTSPVAAPVISIEETPTIAPTESPVGSTKAPATEKPTIESTASSSVATSSVAGLVFATLTMGLLLL